MIERILKIELVFLLMLTLVTTTYFFYGDQFPDNYLSITSFSGDVNFISYYFFSMFSIVGMTVGPWVLVPFVLFAILYHFKYSQRDYKLDVFSVLFLLVFTASFASLLSSEYLGIGIQKIIESEISPVLNLWIMIVSLLVFMGSTFRKSTIKGFRLAMEKIDQFSFADLNESIKEKVEILNLKLENRRRETEFKKSAKQKNQSSSSKGFGDIVNKDKLKKLMPSAKSMKIPKSITDKAKQISSEGAKAFLETDQKPIAKVEKRDDDSQKSEAITQKEVTNQNAIEDQTNLAKNEDGSNDVDESKVANVIGPAIGKKDYLNIVDGLSYKESDNSDISPDTSYFTEIKERIEEKLKEFNINARIINVLKGPVVDTFELELGEGVQLSKVTNRQEDVSLALYGAPIRMVYPLKGKTTIGIEVPRNPREIIFLGEIIQSKEFDKTKAKLPIAMGKDAFGEPFVADLASMPHMLVAGATGAGKSVFINALLVSLLVKLSPEELKLILIDPKQLELALYQNLPHLSLPVITDSGMAMNSLLWAVQEMERRYSILKDLGVRNITTYNEKVKGGGEQVKAKIGKYFNFHEEENFNLPYIVIVIDEFADLMLTKNGKEIETNVSRLAAKARAAGIHLVVATQRPSVDVITGVIKSNFPTRVSFKVTTGKDSSTILDCYGAEKLLGKGDMLFKQGVENIRVHSSFIEEDEIEEITESLSQVENIYDPEALEFLENGPDAMPASAGGGSGAVSSEKDALFDEAVEIILEAKLASASMLQRRLRIGYNRAANLIEALEAEGIVGPANGSKGREVLGRK